MTEDLKQPGRINSMLYVQVASTFDELYRNIKIGIKEAYPKFKALEYQAQLQSMEYSQSRKIYETVEDEINQIFGHSNQMQVPEAIKRIQNTINLFHRIGSFRLRDRNPVPQDEEPDEVVIAYFDYDTSEVPDDEPVVKALTQFYYDELRKEFVDKPNVLRKREALYRAKRAFMFYHKYKEYERSGFDASKIEEIFGISREDQAYLKFWIDQLLHDGKPTIIFASAGSGKSNTGSFIVQLILVLRPEWDVLTNIPFVFAPDIKKYMDSPELLSSYQISCVKLIENMSQLLTETANSILNDRLPAPVLDEMDTAVVSTQSRGKEGVSLQAYTWVERHIDTQGPLFIYHYQGSIPKDLRIGGLAHQIFGVFWYYHRRSRTLNHRRVLSRPDFWQGMSRGLRYLPIPLTSLPYHNQGWSSYKLDVDMQWLNQEIGKATKKEAARRILKLVSERGWEEKDKPKSGKGKKGDKDENADSQFSP